MCYFYRFTFRYIPTIPTTDERTHKRSTGVECFDKRLQYIRRSLLLKQYTTYTAIAQPKHTKRKTNFAAFNIHWLHMLICESAARTYAAPYPCDNWCVSYRKRTHTHIFIQEPKEHGQRNKSVVFVSLSLLYWVQRSSLSVWHEITAWNICNLRGFLYFVRISSYVHTERRRQTEWIREVNANDRMNWIRLILIIFAHKSLFVPK